MQSAATMESRRSTQNWWHSLWRKLSGSLREASGGKGKNCQRSNFLAVYRAQLLKRLVVLDTILACLGFTFPMRIVTLFFNLFFLSGEKSTEQDFLPSCQKRSRGKRAQCRAGVLHSFIALGHTGLKLGCFEQQRSYNPDSSSSASGLCSQKEVVGTYQHLLNPH